MRPEVINGLLNKIANLILHGQEFLTRFDSW